MNGITMAIDALAQGGRMKKRNFFKAAHRDKAEGPIIQALRSVGASVYAVSGKDIPDLLVGFRGVTYMLEVKSVLTNEKKDGYTRTTKTKVSKGQRAFLDGWRGGLAAVVHTPEEALVEVYASMDKGSGRWLAENGAFLCESCWLPEDGLHAPKCPNRTRLKPKPAVQSAHRAAKKMEAEMPKTHGHTSFATATSPASMVAFSRGVEGELQPLKVKG